MSTIQSQKEIDLFLEQNESLSQLKKQLLNLKFKMIKTLNGMSMKTNDLRAKEEKRDTIKKDLVKSMFNKKEEPLK